MYGIIYKATSPDGKVYIGQTIRTLKQRKSAHAFRAKKQDRRTPFQLALLTEGFANFAWEQVDQAETKAELDAKEKYWISHYNSMNPEKGYNNQDGGIHYSPSAETLCKKSEAWKGEKNPMFGKHLTPWNKGLQGAQRHSNETRQKIGEANRNPSVEIRCKLSNARKGKHLSPETRHKLSEANKGQIPWNKGKSGVYSSETRRKISEGNKGEKSGNATISEATARQIKVDLQAGLKMSIIAKKNNVKPYIVEHIKYGRAWAWLTVA